MAAPRDRAVHTVPLPRAQGTLTPAPFRGTMGYWLRSHAMLNQYGPILIFAVIAASFPIILLWLTKLVRPTPPQSAEKLMPYECGITPESDSRGRYTVRYYLIAILFVVFEVETVFLYPWAVQFRVLGLFGLLEMFVFLGILIVGYFWLLKRGALEWI
jgi:NADH-quinone oxidoreductase subunit A